MGYGDASDVLINPLNLLATRDGRRFALRVSERMLFTARLT